MKTRLKLLALGLLVAASLAVTPLWAQQSKPLRIVVPFAAGGSQDVVARYLGGKLGDKLNTPVIVDNKPGAGGILAADAVAKATDGATVLLASAGPISIAPNLQAKLPYDPARDLVPVALVADTLMTLSVRVESPYTSIADVLRDAKARPGLVTYASTGNGSLSHLTGALLAQAGGVSLLHVPYRGAAPALNDLIGGQVALVVTTVGSIEPMLASKSVRVLGTFSREALPSLASVPTVGGATGLPGMEVPAWLGVMAPARMPATTLGKLSAALLEVCNLPETKQRFAQLGIVNTCDTAAALGKVVTEDTQRWAKVIKQGGIKAD